MMSGGHAVRKGVCFYSLMSALVWGHPAGKAHPPSFWRNKHSELVLTTELGFLPKVSSHFCGSSV